MEPILVFGAAGHASVVIDAIERQGRYRIAGLVECVARPGAEVLGYPVLGLESELPQLLRTASTKAMAIAIGDNWQRLAVAGRLQAMVPGLEFPTVIHPRATVARSISCGEGAVLLAGSVINSYASVGRFCLLNTCSSLDHNAVLEEGASLAPNACVGGATHIGRCTSVGLGASVIQKLSVGAHCVIGAGAVLVCDLESGVVAYGNPARVIRRREPDEAYL